MPYLCTTVGVAFINCVPVPVDNMAKRVRSASIFSEWLGKIIEIHHAFGFRMSIVAMGSFAADFVRSTFSSYRDTSTKVKYVSSQNPAAISYMNIHKYPGMQQMQTSIVETETKINMLLGVPMDTIANTGYEWKTYPTDVLHQYMKEETIGTLTRALVEHTVEELAKPFITMSSNLFSNMGSIPSGYRPGALPDTDDRGPSPPEPVDRCSRTSLRTWASTRPG